MLNKPFLFCILGLTLMGCHKKDFFEGAIFCDFGAEKMIQNKEYSFFPQQDSTSFESNKPYDIYLIVRYNRDCEIKKLPLNIEVTQLNFDEIIRKEVTLNLFDKNDNPIGKGNYSLFETTTLIGTEQYPDEKYCVTVSSPLNVTSGIVSIGIGWKESDPSNAVDDLKL